jgi:anti-sigma regulatory factor (Ser/Thr protein kinase)
VTLELAVADGRLEIVVEDQGAGFEPKAVDDWVPEGLDEDGMGLAIIRAVVDELDVQPGRRGNGTRLSLRKALQAP